jgi:tetratricopeptide (TPR) repeat protein
MSLTRVSTVLLLWAAWAAPASALDADEQLKFADGVYSRGMWDIAIKEYQAFIATNPASPQAPVVNYRIAECYRGLGDLPAADKAYARVFADYPRHEYHFRAGLRRSELMDQAKQYDAQIPLLKAMLDEAPAADIASACLYAMGAAYEKTAKEKEAVDAYEQDLAKYPGTPFASYAALALAGLQAKKPGAVLRAIELYQAAATNPASPRVGAEAWFQLGELYFREKLYEKSARAYEKLFQKYPADERIGEARLQMAWAFHNAGLYADAQQQCASALAAGPAAGKEAEWLYLEANCQRQLMRNQDAAQTYSQLLAKYPGGELAESAAYEKALTYYKMGNYQEAVQQARALNLTPRVKKDAYWLLAESYAALKDENNAIQYYRLIVDQFAGSDLAADATYRLAHLLQKKGDFMQASDLFGHLARTFPQHELAPQALFASAYCLSQAKKHEDAIRDWTLLIQKYPASPLVEESLYQKAVSETLLRRDALAITTWRDLLARYPATKFTADAHFWSGVLQEEAGKLEEAEAELRAAAKANPTPELTLRIQFRLALVLQRRSKLEEAAGLFQGLIASPLRDKFSPELLEWLANYHLDRKEFDKATDAAKLLVTRADSDSWQQIGCCLTGKGCLGLGQKEEARAAFEKAVAVNVKTPAAAESYLRLGELALAAGDFPRARQNFDQAAALSASDALLAIRVNAYAGLARTLKAQGDLAGAAKHFLSVGILFDDPTLVPECLHEAADAFQKIGKAEESQKVVKELIQRYPDSPWAKKHQ